MRSTDFKSEARIVLTTTVRNNESKVRSARQAAREIPQ
jgi:hypothetical protein